MCEGWSLNVFGCILFRKRNDSSQQFNQDQHQLQYNKGDGHPKRTNTKMVEIMKE